MQRLLIIFISALMFGCDGNAQTSKKTFPVSKSEKEWKAELSDAEFKVLRQKGTERAFTSEHNYVKEDGTFVCAACGNPLYKTKNKFESGTGWPSFDRAVSNKNVDYRADRTGGFPANEVICANCGGHLGHVFNDGPRNTTGKRHCINGVALDFVPDAKPNQDPS